MKKVTLIQGVRLLLKAIHKKHHIHKKKVHHTHA